MDDFEVRRLDGSGELSGAHAVRRAVFIDEQGVPESVEMDDKDDEATHFVIYDSGDGQAVATARIRAVDDDTVKAERVAVRADYRDEGLGTWLMEAIEEETRDRSMSTVVLHAQTTVEEFYRKLGYETVSGEFDEAGITHVEMVKEVE